MNKRQNKQHGFTLIELLIVVSLVIIATGVSGDIIVSLTRSYSKTRVANEIEQNANYVMLKLEKELKNAMSVTSPLSTSGQADTLEFVVDNGDGTQSDITYYIRGGSDGYIQRDVDGTTYDLISRASTRWVAVDADQSYFENISVRPSPTVVHMVLFFKQAGSPVGKSFTGSVNLETTVVVRGTY